MTIVVLPVLDRGRRATRVFGVGALCLLVSCAAPSAESDAATNPIDTRSVDIGVQSEPSLDDPAPPEDHEQTPTDKEATDDPAQAPTSTGPSVQDLALETYLGNDELHDTLVIDEECAASAMESLTDDDAQRFTDLGSATADEINSAGLSRQGASVMADLASCYELDSVIDLLVDIAIDFRLLSYDDACLRTKLTEIPDLIALIRTDTIAIFEQAAECELTVQDLAADNLVRSSLDGKTVVLDPECARSLAADISDEDAQKLADRDFTDDSNEGSLSLDPQTIAILEQIEQCDSSEALIQALIEIVLDSSPDADVECMRSVLEPIRDLEQRMATDSGGLVALLDQCIE